MLCLITEIGFDIPNYSGSLPYTWMRLVVLKNTGFECLGPETSQVLCWCERWGRVVTDSSFIGLMQSLGGLGRQGWGAELRVGLGDGHDVLEPADGMHRALHEIAAFAHWQAVVLVLADRVHDTVNAMVVHTT